MSSRWGRASEVGPEIEAGCTMESIGKKRKASPTQTVGPMGPVFSHSCRTGPPRRDLTPGLLLSDGRSGVPAEAESRHGAREAVELPLVHVVERALQTLDEIVERLLELAAASVIPSAIQHGLT